MEDIINDLVKIGFCQPKYYKKTVWNYAIKVMDIACKEGYARPYDYGRGKGKYATDLEIEEVARLMQGNREVQKIAKKYMNYRNKLTA